MAVYRRDDLTCGLTACSPGSRVWENFNKVQFTPHLQCMSSNFIVLGVCCYILLYYCGKMKIINECEQHALYRGFCTPGPCLQWAEFRALPVLPRRHAWPSVCQTVPVCSSTTARAPVLRSAGSTPTPPISISCPPTPTTISTFSTDAVPPLTVSISCVQMTSFVKY